MRQNELEMAEMAKSWEQKLAEQNSKEAAEAAAQQEVEAAKVSGNPQILNLNEDGMLDRKIFLDLTKHSAAKVGRKTGNADTDPAVTLGGIGIQQDHATFNTTGNRTQLVPTSAEAAANIYINGQKLTGTSPVDLKPNDRIVFGTGTVFLYRCQQRDSEVSLTDSDENPITYEYAMKEKRAIEDAAEEERKARERAEAEAEAAAKMEALRAQMEAEKAEQEKAQKALQAELEA